MSAGLRAVAVAVLAAVCLALAACGEKSEDVEGSV